MINDLLFVLQTHTEVNATCSGDLLMLIESRAMIKHTPFIFDMQFISLLSYINIMPQFALLVSAL